MKIWLDRWTNTNKTSWTKRWISHLNQVSVSYHPAKGFTGHKSFQETRKNIKFSNVHVGTKKKKLKINFVVETYGYLLKKREKYKLFKFPRIVYIPHLLNMELFVDVFKKLRLFNIVRNVPRIQTIVVIWVILSMVDHAPPLKFF